MVVLPQLNAAGGVRWVDAAAVVAAAAAAAAVAVVASQRSAGVAALLRSPFARVAGCHYVAAAVVAAVTAVTAVAVAVAVVVKVTSALPAAPRTQTRPHTEWAALLQTHQVVVEQQVLTLWG